MRQFVYTIAVSLTVALNLYGDHSPDNFLKTKGELTQNLAQLVSFKTPTKDHQANKKALDWVAKELNNYPLHFKSITHNGSPSLIITTQKTKTPKLWLIAHIDVVPGPQNLFTPTVQGNEMYGRGAMDMKMAIACYMLLVKELNTSLPNYDFGIMLTSDEEHGGEDGVKYLLDEGYTSKIGLDPDGGFDWHIEEEAKGILNLKIMSHGISAHASRPWEGDNAITKLQKILPEIQNLYPKEKQPNIDWFPTVVITVIHGGIETNVIPNYAEATIDVRYPANMSPTEIMKKINDIVERYPGVDLEESISGSPHKVNVNNPYFQLFRRIAKEKYNIDVKTTKSYGASDARYFGEKGIPVLVITPKGGDIHSDDEWVDLDDLVRFYEVMKEWVIQVALVKTDNGS